MALQYTEVTITFKLRPIRDLFSICDLSGNYIRPDFNNSDHQLYYFTKPPPANNIYNDKKIWDSDVHLIANYAFLSKEENNAFVSRPQTYLIKEVFENTFHDLVGHNKIKTYSTF